jgi:hypothetical protein
VLFRNLIPVDRCGHFPGHAHHSEDLLLSCGIKSSLLFHFDRTVFDSVKNSLCALILVQYHMSVRVWCHWRSPTFWEARPRGSASVRPLARAHNPCFPPHPPHNFIGSCHVTDVSYNCSFFTLPSYLSSCAEVLSKADERGPSGSSTCLPVAIVQVNYRYTCYPSRSSSRIRQIPQRRCETDKVVGPNCKRPQCVFCRHLRGRQPGRSRLS